MSTPAQLRPELAGVKVKKRKKDLKSKYEPEEFAEELIDEIKEAEGNLELISKKLDSIADSLDFKKYVEPLFDVLFTGGILEVGGGHVEGIELSPFSIFAAEETAASIKKFVEVFNLLIRRYRYLQKGFEDGITKMLRLLVRFTPSECKKLAIACTFFFNTQMAPMSLLSVLFMDHLVKEGHSLQFITVLFKEFIAEQSVEHLTSSLKKNGLDDRLMEFFPASKRTEEFFTRHFVAEGLKEIVTFHEKKNQSKLRNDFKENLQRLINDKAPATEAVAFLKQSKATFPDAEAIGLIWESLVGSIEWSRRPEQCEEQLLKVVKEWGKLLAVVVSNAKTELHLLIILQNYCYDDSRFTKTFSKLVTLFYKFEILSETAIVYWHTKGASPKGKSVFLQQMEPFIKWLNEAEEESGGEN